MIEKNFERVMYASRWFLAPIYIGLSLVLLLLGVKFFQEIFHVFPQIFNMKEKDLVLFILSMVDIALVGGLIVMVMFSGYENFISKLDISEDSEKLSWLGKLDAGSLKQKVAASIVAISSIHLLQKFMGISATKAQEINGVMIEVEKYTQSQLMWFTILHLTFVLSALGMAWVDRINRN